MKFGFKKKLETKERSQIRSTIGNILEYSANPEKEFINDNSYCGLTGYGNFLR